MAGPAEKCLYWWVPGSYMWSVAPEGLLTAKGLERGVLTEERVGEVRRDVMGTRSGRCTEAGV